MTDGMADKFKLQKYPLHCPSLEEVASVLETGLRQNFSDVSVTVVDCPDLSQEPFMLAAPGLCGSPRVADVGGVPNLVPLVKKEKIYNLERVAEQTELETGLLVGAGAGPHHVEGVNCENGHKIYPDSAFQMEVKMMANIKMAEGDEKTFNNTHIAKISTEDNSPVVKKPGTTDFALMANLFISEGKPGKILEVKAGSRTGDMNYMSCLRSALAKHYGNKPVGLGGCFLVEKGKAKLHIMPNFSACPLESDAAVEGWLKFFEMSAPLTCLGYVISHDPDLDLRMEHFHCFSQHGDGGHYHYDTTPNDVQYRGYLNVAEFLYRIDRPMETHQIGRD